jgi:hypothetical protein
MTDPKMKARDWLNLQGYAYTYAYHDTCETAKRLYPYLNIREGIAGLSESDNPRWKEGVVNGIIDREEEWGFDRNDWFILGNDLFCTDDGLMVRFKLMQ